MQRGRMQRGRGRSGLDTISVLAVRLPQKATIIEPEVAVSCPVAAASPLLRRARGRRRGVKKHGVGNVCQPNTRPLVSNPPSGRLQ